MRITHIITAMTSAALLALTAHAREADTQSLPDRAEVQAENAFRNMTRREKIAQLFFLVYGDYQDARTVRRNMRFLRKGAGGIIVMEGGIESTARLMNRCESESKIPLFLALDGEWGVGMRYYSVPSFPRQMQLGALGDESMVFRMGRLIGQECRDFGFNVNFAPVVDINNNPGNPVINTRSFGEDKDKVARYSIAYMKGLKSAGVAGSAKHFPGHGDTNVDSHKGLPVIDFDRARLDSMELYPFRRQIEAGVDMVMVGHLSVPSIDPSGTAASISGPVITGLLRNELGFEGVICTDALDMSGLIESSGLDQDEIPLAAMMAGSDILLMPEDCLASMRIIRRALRKGKVTQAQIDEKVRRILLLKARMGLFDEKESGRSISLDNIETRGIRAENLALMDEIAENSMTLVCGDVTAPKRGGKTAYLAYMDTDAEEGSFEGVGGYPGLSPEKTAEAFFDTLKEYEENVDFLRFDGSDAQLARLDGYERIIIGFHNYNVREQNEYDIPRNVLDFMYSLPSEKLCCVYFGNPYILDRIDYRHFGTFIIAYQNTTFNAKAAAKVVENVIPARGVLPVSAGGLPCGYGR